MGGPYFGGLFGTNPNTLAWYLGFYFKTTKMSTILSKRQWNKVYGDYKAVIICVLYPGLEGAHYFAGIRVGDGRFDFYNSGYNHTIGISIDDLLKIIEEEGDSPQLIIGVKD